MYEQHFGLERRPFPAKARGSDVFVGPQIATTMAGIKKAMAENDAIVTVTGPIGSGKTTLVLKALGSIGSSSKIISIGRIHMQSSDVLEFLLEELGIKGQPGGAIQKFLSLRRHLQELAKNGGRVYITVEDGVRLGADTLAEIEALTAADAGVSDGANVVLMGDERLAEILADPTYDRIQQRTRQRYAIAPFSDVELRGYLRHCFRLAGGDFQALFEANAAPLLHHLSAGLPRVANNVVDAAMRAAVDQGETTVSSQLLQSVAEKDFGLSAAGFDLEASVAQESAALPPVESKMSANADVPPVLDLPPEPEAPVVSDVPVEAEAPAELDIVAEPEAPLLSDAVTEPVPLAVAEIPAEPQTPLVLELPTDSKDLAITRDSAEPAVASAPVAEAVPELIQDTLPDLKVLAPELANASLDPEPASVTETSPEPAELPLLETEEPKSDPVADDVPAWDRDPTMAELTPDLAALEQAMAFAQPDASETKTAERAAVSPAEPVVAANIPEITLDHAINQGINNQLIDEPGEISAPGAPIGGEAAEKPPIVDAKKPAKKADSELDKIASELAKAKSIEDVDDRMAETLFGGELSLAASQFIAKPPIAEPLVEEPMVAEPMVENNQGEELQIAQPANEAIGVAVAVDQPDPAVQSKSEELTLEAPAGPDAGGVDLSASQRLKTVRALNADLHPSLHEPQTPAANDSPAAPESIEDQINTSMTQTLKALNIRPPVNDDDLDEDEQESKSGFFSRFKRS